MHPITRRQVFKLSALSVAVVVVAGCNEDQVRKLAIVAIVIGGITLRLPAPALRVLGITLIIAGQLVVEYLQQDGDQVKEIFDISKETVDKLIKDRKVLLERADGKTESFPVGEVDYGPK
jgi:hypothetical protein